jgi:alanine dehydrogenase
VGELLYLTRQEVIDLQPPIGEQIDIAERTFREMAAGRVQLPPKPGVHPRDDSFIHAMPAYLADEDVAALKWVGGFPANKQLGLPYISGVIVLNDASNGFPIAIMDAAEITAARTAAASGVCIRRWAPPGWRAVALVGCGEQGRYHSRVVADLNPEATIRGFDPRPGRVRALYGRVETAGSAREAVEGADVVITAAPIVRQPEPVIDSEWLGDRYLALPIDFDASVRVGPIAAAGLVATDDIAQFEYYRAQGHFRGWPAPHRSVGEALERGDTAERVVVCNLGVGALDAAFGRAVLDRALEAGAGTRLPR